MSRETGESSSIPPELSHSALHPIPSTSGLTIENVERLERHYEATGQYSPEKAVEQYIMQMNWTNAEELFEINESQKAKAKEAHESDIIPEYGGSGTGAKHSSPTGENKKQIKETAENGKQFDSESQSALNGLFTSPSLEFDDSVLQKKVMEHANLLPNVGPPTVLAFKQESKKPPPDFDVNYFKPSEENEVEFEEPDDTACEFSDPDMIPLVRKEEMVSHPCPEELFSSESYQRLCEYVLEEEDEVLIPESAQRTFDVSPHLSSQEPTNDKSSMERPNQKLDVPKEKVQFRTPMGTSKVQDSTAYNEADKKAEEQADNQDNENMIKTISYQLSTATLSGREDVDFPPSAYQNFDDIFTICSEDLHKKRYHEVIRKYYPNGKTFLTIFKDGSGQVFYPTGRIAIMISFVHPADFTYLILEDSGIRPQIQAIFTSKGRSTCYYPNGAIWVNLDGFGGCHYDEKGTLKKRWAWHFHNGHIHAPPIQPICLGLNSQTGIRILSQEEVYVTFSHKRNRVRFNMGSKLRLKEPKQERVTGSDVIRKVLQQKTLKIHTLLDKIQTAVKCSQCLPKLHALPSSLSKLEEQKSEEESSRKSDVQLSFDKGLRAKEKKK